LKVKTDQLFQTIAASRLYTLQQQYSVMWRNAATMISNLARRYYQKFAAAATITDQALKKRIKKLKNVL
jgi:hypothetical protein